MKQAINNYSLRTDYEKINADQQEYIKVSYVLHLVTFMQGQKVNFFLIMTGKSVLKNVYIRRCHHSLQVTTWHVSTTHGHPLCRKITSKVCTYMYQYFAFLQKTIFAQQIEFLEAHPADLLWLSSLWVSYYKKYDRTAPYTSCLFVFYLLTEFILLIYSTNA